MIIIPYATDLHLGRRAYVTIAIVVLCLAIHWLAERRDAAIAAQFGQFCADIQITEPTAPVVGFLEGSNEACEYFLATRHDFQDEQAFREFLYAYNEEEETLEPSELQELVAEIEHRYTQLAEFLPAYLQDRMAQYPSNLNPIPMLVSSFSHTDWWHVAGNLVFFYAFAAPVEAVIGPFLFGGSIILLSLFCGFAYSMFCFLSTGCLPTVGLSGVVMGVIGMSAFLMPKARVNTVMIHGLVGWRFMIPAWVLALVFLSLDLWDLIGGAMADTSVNFLAHVAGGMGGYLGARLFLSGLRNGIQYQLDEAVEIAALNRGPSRGSLAREQITKRQLENEIRAANAQKKKDMFDRDLYRWARTRNSAQAQLLLLQDYDLWSRSPEIYEDLLQEVGTVEMGRTWLCLGRLCIHLYLQTGRYGRAVAVAEQLAASYPRLELGSPSDALLLARQAINMHRESLAWALLCEPETRYGGCLKSAEFAPLISILQFATDTPATINNRETIAVTSGSE